MIMRRFLREPLLHFLAGGAALFGFFTVTQPARMNIPSDKRISVDKESLLNFLQYRSKAFQTEYFSEQLQAMSAEERKRIEDEYIAEELLYREAKALGLEQGDYVIRQRLVQKMRFLINDLAEATGGPSDAMLEEHLQNYKERFIIDPAVTFTHVFTDSSVRGDAQARTEAERLKVSLNTNAVTFNDAPGFGDRFPFLQNYVERTFDYVSSHFGSGFVSELKNVPTSETRWAGPIRSTHGYHLVLLTYRTEARLPALHEIKPQVEDDWLRDRLETARSQAMIRLASEYTIERETDAASSK